MSHRAGWSIGKRSTIQNHTTISGFRIRRLKVQSICWKSPYPLTIFWELSSSFVNTFHTFQHAILDATIWYLVGLLAYPSTVPVHGQTCGSQGTSPATGRQLKFNPQTSQQAVSKNGTTPNLSNLFVDVYFQKTNFMEHPKMDNLLAKQWRTHLAPIQRCKMNSQWFFLCKCQDHCSPQKEAFKRLLILKLMNFVGPLVPHFRWQIHSFNIYHGPQYIPSLSPWYPKNLLTTYEECADLGSEILW